MTAVKQISKQQAASGEPVTKISLHTMMHSIRMRTARLVVNKRNVVNKAGGTHPNGMHPCVERIFC